MRKVPINQQILQIPLHIRAQRRGKQRRTSTSRNANKALIDTVYINATHFCSRYSLVHLLHWNNESHCHISDTSVYTYDCRSQTHYIDMLHTHTHTHTTHRGVAISTYLNNNSRIKLLSYDNHVIHLLFLVYLKSTESKNNTKHNVTERAKYNNYFRNNSQFTQCDT